MTPLTDDQVAAELSVEAPPPAPAAAPRAAAKLGKGYLPTLDGWRTVAIGMVLLNHDRAYHLGPLSTEWFVRNGGNGVQVFFALSGILICTRLLQEEAVRGRIDLRGFYIRRLCRIQPASLAYLAVVSLLMLSGAIERSFPGVFFSIVLLRNYLPVHPGLATWYTAHFWSLSVEEHFYLLLPGFLLLVPRFRVRILVPVVALFELWRHLAVRMPALANAGNGRTDMELNAILLGALAAILLARPAVLAWCVRWLRPGVALLIAAAIAVWQHFYPEASLLFFAILLTYPIGVVSTMLHPRSLAGRVLELAPFRFVGRISYSLYLWQMLFFTGSLGIAAPHWRALGFVQEHAPLRYGVLLLVSLASYYGLEKPIMRLGHRLAKPATPGRGDLAV